MIQYFVIYSVYEVIMQMNFFQNSLTGMYTLFFKMLHALVDNV